MEDRQDAAIETSQGALLPDLSRTRRGEPIKRHDHGDETLAEIWPQLQCERLDDFEADNQ